MTGLRPKQLVRLGMFDLEEAVLDILLEARYKGECIGSAEIGRRGGGDILRGGAGTSRDWTVWHILKNLRLKVVSRPTLQAAPENLGNLQGRSLKDAATGDKSHKASILPHASLVAKLQKMGI